MEREEGRGYGGATSGHVLTSVSKGGTRPPRGDDDNKQTAPRWFTAARDPMHKPSEVKAPETRLETW